MAKKYEFRPDKPRTSWLSHLVLTQNQQKNLFKWVVYAVTLVVLSVIQDVLLSRVRLFGASTELIPCGIFLICMLEGAQAGSVFSLIASLLYLFSGTAPGPYAMVFITFLSVGVCLFRQAFLQPGFFAALLCCTVAMGVYEMANFLFGLFLGLAPLSRMYGFLITAALSLVAVPVLYPILKAISAIGGQTWKE